MKTGDKKSKLPGSFDARDWADEFVESAYHNPSIPTDRDTMIAWFSSAIMTGHDEAMRRRNKESLVANAARIYGERAALVMLALLITGVIGFVLMLASIVIQLIK